MTKIRLELDFIEIHRKRKKWNLYFIFATDHPEDPQKTVLAVFPSEPIPISTNDNNRVDFEPQQGAGNDLNGLFILEREMPEDESIRVRLWVVQSRDKTRNIGEVMEEISQTVSGNQVTETILNALGAASPWITISNALLKMSGIVGKFLKESKDSKKGFVNMDESFTPEEIALGDLDRTNALTGFGEVGWTWVVTRSD